MFEIFFAIILLPFLTLFILSMTRVRVFILALFAPPVPEWFVPVLVNDPCLVYRKPVPPHRFISEYRTKKEREFLREYFDTATLLWKAHAPDNPMYSYIYQEVNEYVTSYRQRQAAEKERARMIREEKVIQWPWYYAYWTLASVFPGIKSSERMLKYVAGLPYRDDSLPPPDGTYTGVSGFSGYSGHLGHRSLLKG